MEQNNQNAPISNGAVDPKAAVLQPGGPTQMVDKLQVDAQRNTIKEMRCVHIFWENKFVGIYNFSVFLLTKLGGASLRMKKTRNKQTAEYVVVGFPNARDSFEKFLPSWATLQFAADGHTYFMIPEEHMSDAELTNVFAQYTDWVAAIPLTPSKSEKEKENKNETQVSAPVIAPSANNIILPQQHKRLLGEELFLS